MGAAHLGADTARRLVLLFVGLMLIAMSLVASTTHHPATLRLVENGSAVATGEAPAIP